MVTGGFKVDPKPGGKDTGSVMGESMMSLISLVMVSAHSLRCMISLTNCRVPITSAPALAEQQMQQQCISAILPITAMSNHQEHMSSGEHRSRRALEQDHAGAQGEGGFGDNKEQESTMEQMYSTNKQICSSQDYTALGSTSSGACISCNNNNNKKMTLLFGDMKCNDQLIGAGAQPEDFQQNQFCYANANFEIVSRMKCNNTTTVKLQRAPRLIHEAKLIKRKAETINPTLSQPLFVRKQGRTLSTNKPTMMSEGKITRNVTQ
ncbi:unnamed protein product [Notodromas monacha]|uniref:Uncharacterized protein n=1 Tax=Notodromas monacha TaxID=399045 RepID=A0A7R9BMB7_9CRUS|nr:unnamed protein product [Notodromas monacha]CAG0918149.1 unnamed protein product [Notodromas monacha]